MTAPTLSVFLSELAERREQLGMPPEVLAKKANIPLLRVQQILQGHTESTDATEIARIAHILGVTVVGSFGPTVHYDREDLALMRQRQAEHQARRAVGLVQGTMALESQAVGQSHLTAMMLRTRDRLLAGPAGHIWYD